MAKKNTLKDLNSFLNQQPKRLDSEDTLVESPELDYRNIQEIAEAIKMISKENGGNTTQLLSALIETILEDKEDKTANDYLLLNSAVYLNAVNK